jgi:hypothetical protein
MDLGEVTTFGVRLLEKTPRSAHTLPYLRLGGALARCSRLQATASDSADDFQIRVKAAAQAQQQIVRAIQDLMHDQPDAGGDLSFQFSELYLLASLLVDRPAARSLREAADSVRLQSGVPFSWAPQAFIDLSRTRCCIIEGVELEAAQATLSRISMAHHAPELHVQASALRWLHRLNLITANAAGADAALNELGLLTKHSGERCAVFHLLAKVDLWVERGANDGEVSHLHGWLQQLIRERRAMGFGRFLANLGPRGALMRMRERFPY